MKRAANWVCVRRNRSCTHVLFETNVAATGESTGGTDVSAVWTACGIHSTKKSAFLFCIVCIASSTARLDRSWPRKRAAAVRKRPVRMSVAAIMFDGSNSCCVRSAILRRAYSLVDVAVSGAYDEVRKCRRGNGIKLVASLRRSELSCPGNRSGVVMPDMTLAIRPFSSA